MHFVLPAFVAFFLTALIAVPVALAAVAGLTALAAAGRPRHEFFLAIIGKGTVVWSFFITLVLFEHLGPQALKSYVIATGILGICHKLAREVNEVVVKEAENFGSGLIITMALYGGAVGVCYFLADLPIPYLLGEMVNGVILTPLRVMRKGSPQGRLWGLWATLAYTLPYAAGAGILLAFNKPEGIGYLTLICSLLGTVPCWVWLKNGGCKAPELPKMKKIIAQALPGIAAEGPGFLVRSLSTLALAGMAVSEAALWAKFGAFLGAMWDIISQIQTVGADRLARARRDEQNEAEAEGLFWRLMWSSAGVWVIFGVVLAPLYGLPTPIMWVLVTLPKLASSLGTRHLDAKGLRAELAVCTAANYLAACIPLFFMEGISALVGAEVVGGLISCAIGVWYLRKSSK